MIFTNEREAKIAQGLLSALRPIKQPIGQSPLWKAAKPEIIRLLGEDIPNPRDANYQEIIEMLVASEYLRGTGGYRFFNLQTPVIMAETARKFFDETYT